ncbi:MAG: nucleotidyl transferase AbiEii/AbiGii toxin family protein [Candidatus Humimicrobiaceae bacterium]
MITLHEDIDAFRVLLENVHDRTGYRLDVLEKDYYVTLLLRQLADKQINGLQAYFKGGTALYKALKNIRRFSEDVDLSVDARNCSRTQSDKRLHQATKEYDFFKRSLEEGFTNRSEVMAVYTYSPQMEFDVNDSLQRFGKIKVEATSFTISEPYAALEITPTIYDAATDKEKQILSEKYKVKPFNVLTMTIERIFIDKLFAAEAYTRNAHIDKRAFDAAKHIYDLCVLADNEIINSFINNKELFRKIIDIRLEEEIQRRDGISGVELKSFSFFFNALDNVHIIKAYEIMQNQYVLKAEDIIPVGVAVQKLIKLSNLLGVPKEKT